MSRMEIPGEPMKAAEKRKEQAEAKTMLLKFLTQGDTVISLTRSWSRSGITRTMEFYIVNRDKVTGKSPASPSLWFLTGYIATLLGYRRTKDGALIASDDAFSVVVHLQYALWGIEGGTNRLHVERI